MYIVCKLGFFVALILFTQCNDLMTLSPLCGLSEQNAKLTDKDKGIFPHFSNFILLRDSLVFILNDFKALPEKILYLSKLSINHQLKEMKPKVQELSSYSIRLFDYLESRFDVARQKYVSPLILEGRLNDFLENIMISTLIETGDPKQMSYAIEDLIRCSQATDLVSPTLNLVGKLKEIWKDQVVLVLREYASIYRMLEVTMAYLDYQPLRTCRLGLNRLLQGCSSVSTVTNKSTNVGTICPGYCTNVVRGCLAPLLLFLPVQSDKSNMVDRVAQKSAWHRLLVPPREGSARNQIQAVFDQLLSSLNATALMNLIEHGLEKAEKELPRIMSELDIFCGNGVLQTRSPNNERSNTPVKPRTRVRDEQSLAEVLKRQTELVEFMRSLGQRLTTLATELTQTEQFAHKIEERFCRVGLDDESTTTGCWNGTHHGSYTKPVPPFTQDGQLRNPEITYNSIELPNLPVVNRHLEPARPLQDPDSTFQHSPPYWPDGPDSSGFLPDSADPFIPLPPTNEAMNFPPFFPGPSSPPPPRPPIGDQNSNWKCSPDDEDCTPPGKDEPEEAISSLQEVDPSPVVVDPDSVWLDPTTTTTTLSPRINSTSTTTDVVATAEMKADKEPRISNQTIVSPVKKKGSGAPIVPSSVLLTTCFMLFYVSYFRYFSDSNIFSS